MATRLPNHDVDDEEHEERDILIPNTPSPQQQRPRPAGDDDDGTMVTIGDFDDDHDLTHQDQARDSGGVGGGARRMATKGKKTLQKTVRIVTGGADGDDDGDGRVEPGNVSLEFFRREVLRVSVFVFFLSLPCLVMTPLVGLLMVTTSVMVSYWLRDNIRFQHGGDSQKCVNRNCALMFFNLCSGVSMVIIVIDLITLGINLGATNSESSQKTSAASSGGSVNSEVHRTTMTTSQRHAWRLAEFIIQLVMLPLLAYGTYCTKRLRDILTPTP